MQILSSRRPPFLLPGTLFLLLSVPRIACFLEINTRIPQNSLPADNTVCLKATDVDTVSVAHASPWATRMKSAWNPYRSSEVFPADKECEWEDYLSMCHRKRIESGGEFDPFWDQTKMEAQMTLEKEPEAGPQIYQGILSHPSLLEAICTVISHEIQTELILAPALKNLFLETLTSEDEFSVRLDLKAVTERCASVENAMQASLFHSGFHALVCYRVGHRLWQAERTGLAYYMQSTVSRIYSADIHPACRLGSGTYVRVGAGVVIGETAIVGNDVSILEGVTLGGTGKESGDRHPKVGNGAIIEAGGTILGNIPVGEGAIVQSKSIVTKPVPKLAIVGGVPATVVGHRHLSKDSVKTDLEKHLVDKYFDTWVKMEEDATSTVQI